MESTESETGAESTRLKFSARNVPGEGDCMFLAVAFASAVSMGLASRTRANGLDEHDDTAMLRTVAKEMRQLVAKILSSEGNILIAGKRICAARDLLKSAAAAEGMAPAEYLARLAKDGRSGGLNGGGPELTILSNILRRPISVYEVYKPDVIHDSGAIRAGMESGWQNPGAEAADGSMSSKDVEDGSSCRIQRLGSFADSFVDPCARIPNPAVLSDQTASDPGLCSWGLHILVLDTGSTVVEKHALALLPQF